jgi:hypothetical protein
MNTFLTSYSKNKGGASARTYNQQQDVIAERRAEESGSPDGMQLNLVPVPRNETVKHPTKPGGLKQLSEVDSNTLKIDVRSKEGFKDLVRF